MQKEIAAKCLVDCSCRTFRDLLVQFLTEHARTQTYISKRRFTLVGKYSHAASEVARKGVCFKLSSLVQGLAI